MLHALSSMPKLKDLQLPGITKDGKDWLTMALDPFHDSQVPIRGLPDRTNSNSIVEIYTQQYTLSAPAGTAGTWSAHVFTLPVLASLDTGLNVRPTGRGSGVLPHHIVGDASALLSVTSDQMGYVCADNSSDASIKCSLVNVHAWDTDVINFFPAPGTTAWRHPDTIQHFGKGGDSMGRVVGAGIEIINNTAPLNQQGACTVSRSPSHRYVEPANCWLGNTATKNPFDTTTASSQLNGDISTVSFSTQFGPPASIEAANAFSSTKTWRAAEGCYSVVSFDLDEVPFSAPGRRASAFINTAKLENQLTGTTLKSADSLATVTKLFGDPVANDGAVKGKEADPAYEVHCDNTSIMLTGLSKETTFTIAVRYIIEKAPRILDAGGSDLVRLSSPSANYDSVALKAYRHTIALMPVGVPSKYNPLGEYWNHIVGLVAKAAPILSNAIGAIPLPTAQLVSKALGMAGNAASAAQTASTVAKVVKTVRAAVKNVRKKKLVVRKKGGRR
jgi:hypothetical protein